MNGVGNTHHFHEHLLKEVLQLRREDLFIKKVYLTPLLVPELVLSGLLMFQCQHEIIFLKMWFWI